MRLESFRVTNYRSVNDSGDIDIVKLTALLGRNESGKSNLLRALQSLNPPGGVKPLDPVKDFPRSRSLAECTPKTRVLSTLWSLDDSERTELIKILPWATSTTRVRVGRNYDEIRWVEIIDCGQPPFDRAALGRDSKAVVAGVRSLAASLVPEKRNALEAEAESFLANSTSASDHLGWAAVAAPAAASLRVALNAVGATLMPKELEILDRIERAAATIAGSEASHTKARQLIVSSMPTLIFIEEYPELVGHQNIAEYLLRVSSSKASDADRSFEKLCKVAGLDPAQLHDLQTKNEPETRNQLANRASALVTTEIKRLWKDRPLKIRFNLDAQHLDTFISDPNAIYDVEVNLNERSRGFQWFFAFYVTFAADTKGGSAEKAILLLDEPGLYLHARHNQTSWRTSIRASRIRSSTRRIRRSWYPRMPSTPSAL